MARKRKKKPSVLMIEGTTLHDTLIFALEDLASNNQSIQEEIDHTNDQIKKTRKIIKGL